MHSPLWQLFLMRVRWFAREPSALFWVFVFPLLASAVLGTAFRESGPSSLSVAVIRGTGAEGLSTQLNATEGLSATLMDEAQARDYLKRGKILAIVAPGAPPGLVLDPTQEESRMARLLVVDALERSAGRVDVVNVSEQAITRPGARYIDFLIPGLLGYGLMAASVFGIGFPIVESRRAKLLKRLVATPMPRSYYLLSFVLARTVLAFLEVLFFIAFAHFLFDVQVTGSVLEVFALGLIGSLTFAGIGLAIVCRAQNSDAAQGIMNLATSSMLVLSGVFFAASRFPAWAQPLLQVLPLTALVDALRAVMHEGAPLAEVWEELAILASWGVACFGVALKWFRWS